MSNELIYSLQEKAVMLLSKLIATPSFSREEHDTADVLQQFMKLNGVETKRHLNNIWAVNRYFDPAKSSILLNSHHDTVRPAKGYTTDPFIPLEKDGKLYGLGSNDAGAALVSLLAAFLYYYEKQDLSYNLVFAASAEEEISGRNGIEALLPLLPVINAAIVGEPTRMDMAIAERGLLVLDAESEGTPGHVAGDTGVNALYIAIDDIAVLKSLQFDRVSELLGPVKVSVTVIETDNKAHNVIPASCRFVVDVRVNELYSLEEVAELIARRLRSTVRPRSFRMRSTMIPLTHPLVQSGLAMGKHYYGSPTTSDKALMPFPALKVGPGDSARSHTADEFIWLQEIKDGISDYVQLLKSVL